VGEKKAYCPSFLSNGNEDTPVPLLLRYGRDKRGGGFMGFNSTSYLVTEEGRPVQVLEGLFEI